MLRSALAAISVSAIFVPLAGATELVPHRAVYDLVFVGTGEGRGITGARGRIVFEIGGASCVGWTVTFRQVVEMTSENAPPRLTDLSSTNFESGDGKLFRFLIERRNDGVPGEKTEGRAERKEKDIHVELKSPKADSLQLPADVTYPTEHTRKIIAAARAGESIVQLPIYDGSENGKRIYDTLAVIGKPIEGEDSKIEEPLKSLAEGKSRRWPTKLSYYKKGEGGDNTPIYTLNFDMYENGISANLLLDYGHIRMRGEMKRFELLKAPRC